MSWPNLITSLFLLAIAVLAFNSADTDEVRFSKGLPPLHGKNLIRRLCIGGVIYALACTALALAVLFCEAPSMWGALALIPIGFGWWDGLFRLFLNLMRKKPWWYLGPSLRGKQESAIDTVFWKAAYGLWVRDGEKLEFYATGRRAGTWAYVADALLVAIGAIALVLLSRADAMPG